MLFDVGGLALLLYMDQRAKRDISNAFNASAVRIQSGLCEPEMYNEIEKMRSIDVKKGSVGRMNIFKRVTLTCCFFWLLNHFNVLKHTLFQFIWQHTHLWIV